MQLVLAAVGNPHEAYNIIHVAGTNGKGSVTLKCAKALENQGFKIGLYISPHIVTFRERIQQNGTLISRDEVVKYISIIKEIDIPLSYFGYVTVMALMYFRDCGVSWVALETGLGGTRDATNVVIPKVSVITSIGLDHCNSLGHTIEEIASQKAGIIKPSIPVVIGPSVPIEVISKFAEDCNSTVIQVTEKFSDYDSENAEIARVALRLVGCEDECIAQGIPQKQIFRYTEYLHEERLQVIIDVCHNIPGFEQVLAQTELKYPEKSITICMALTRVEDKSEIFEIISRYTQKVYNIRTTHSRFSTETQVQNSKFVDQGTVQDMLPRLLADLGSQDLLLVCGSFYFMKDLVLFMNSIDVKLMPYLEPEDYEENN